MKKILLAALITVTAQNALASPSSDTKRALCVNLMQMAEHLSKGAGLGLSKAQLRPPTEQRHARASHLT